MLAASCDRDMTTYRKPSLSAAAESNRQCRSMFEGTLFSPLEMSQRAK
jgi:hypothetical protein